MFEGRTLCALHLYGDNKNMKKILKTAGTVLSVILLVLILFVASVYICNKMILKTEEPLLTEPIGQKTEIDGHNMNIYTEGEGEHTIVFLSGSGTALPVLDFKSLYSLLSDDYRIVVIEKFGYGFSDVVKTERSFGTMLRQDREALAEAGIEGPFILCPHSMSGLEAILWAQKYPEEVEAIVGLDAAFPEAYDYIDIDRTVRFEKIGALGRKLGLVRFYYTDRSIPGDLTKEEKDLYKAVGCRIAVNDSVINEAIAIPDAVKEINNLPKPDIPTLLFVSDGKETGVEKWREIQREYAADLTDAKVIEYDCGHYLHNFMQEDINKEIRSFIAGLE